METRLDTFHGWQMKAIVETRPTTTGSLKYYIVQPTTYKEFSAAEPLSPAMKRQVDFPFDTADAAFYSAFSDCRRAIRNAIRFRGLQEIS